MTAERSGEMVALIPARGGSKRVPGKNMRRCAGRPLLAYSCDAARESRRIDRALVSTDDPEIAALARENGVEAPFLRPAALASDAAPSLPVLLHALDWLEAEGVRVEAVVLLQPTSPLRSARHVDEAVDLFQARSAASLVSVVETPHQHLPHKVMREKDGVLTPYLEAAEPEARLFSRNGPAIVISRPEVLRGGALYGTPNLAYEMPAEVSLDIDTPFDFRIAEYLLTAQAEDSSNARNKGDATANPAE